MNADNIQKLIDALEHEVIYQGKPVAFRMNLWLTVDVFSVDEYAVGEEKGYCGSVGCMGGMTDIIFGFLEAFPNCETPSKEYEKVFDLPWILIKRLFFPEGIQTRRYYYPTEQDVWEDAKNPITLRGKEGRKVAANALRRALVLWKDVTKDTVVA